MSPLLRDEQAVRLAVRGGARLELDARHGPAATRASGGRPSGQPEHALADAGALARIVAARPTRRLAVLAGEDHFFARGTAELRRTLESLVGDPEPGS